VLGSRVFDRTTALVAAILLATIPIAIGYSRYGWDASQTPLFSMIAVYFALRGRPIAWGLAIAACLIVHLSNFFLVPLLLPPLLIAVRKRYPDKPRIFWFLWLAVGLGTVAISWHFRNYGSQLAFTLIKRLSDFDEMGRFIAYWGGLFSGISLYESVVGGVSNRAVLSHDVVFWSVVLVVGVMGGSRIVRDRERLGEGLALPIGLILSLVALYLLTGVDTTRPGYERYAIFSVVPGILVFASLLRRTCEGGGSFAATTVPLLVAAILGAVMLVDFDRHYFEPLRTIGSSSHPTFRTAGVEPKLQAFRLIVKELDRRSDAGRPEKTTTIVAETWWTYQPLLYLAHARKDINVVFFEDLLKKGKTSKEAIARSVLEGAFLVGFAEGDFDRFARANESNGIAHRWVIHDRAGKEAIVVVRLSPFARPAG
jgi:hypothetical protein